MLRRFFSCDNIPTAHQNIAYRLKFCARFWVPQEQKLFDFMFLLHYSSKENLNLPFTSPFFIEIEQATWKISRHACRVSAPYQFSRLLTKTAYQHGSTGLGDDEYSSSNQRWDIISLHTGALAARTQRSHSTIVYTIWGDRPGVTRVLVGWPLSSTSHSPVRSQFRVRVWRRHSERCPLCGGELKEKKTPLPLSALLFHYQGKSARLTLPIFGCDCWREATKLKPVRAKRWARERRDSQKEGRKTRTQWKLLPLTTSFVGAAMIEQAWMLMATQSRMLLPAIPL